jgi:hypothetical protein
MSLKMFHVVFVTAAELLTVGFSAWGFLNYFGSESGGSRVDLWYGIISAAAAMGLLVYGRYFLKKLRNVSYL